MENLNKYKMVVLLGILLITLTPMALTPLAVQREIYSKHTDTPPTIDGAIGQDEWASAVKYIDVGIKGWFTVFLMHDQDYLYVAMRVYAPNPHYLDLLYICFDEGDDGSYGSGSADGVLKTGQDDMKGIKVDG